MSSYVPSVFQYQRRPTRVVAIGDSLVGGSQAIRVQSMTTTPTFDADATVEQVVALHQVGCEVVRVTVPSKRDVEALPIIRAKLEERGLKVPLVADIHFAPKLAMACVEYVDKVRINPGNFVDSKKFAVLEYSDEDYAAEVQRIEEAFTPLVLAMKAKGIAMRIGTNHGSLSDRILNRYGDTPHGMVESAMEFTRVCQKLDYHDVVMSMKASNPIVMIQAYRLLAERMQAEGMDYPFHLGVTEAGDGLDARVKSAVGIGSLLLDGIGDTIRVSLTESPMAEVPVGFELVKLLKGLEPSQKSETGPAWTVDPYLYNRRASRLTTVGDLAYGGGAVPRVEVDLKRQDLDPEFKLFHSQVGDGIEVLCADIESIEDFDRLPNLQAEATRVQALLSLHLSAGLWSQAEAWIDRVQTPAVARLELTLSDLNDGQRSALSALGATLQGKGLALKFKLRESSELSFVDAFCQRNPQLPVLLAVILESLRGRGLDRARALFANLKGKDWPVILEWAVEGDFDPVLAMSSLMGSLLCDGLGDGLLVPARQVYDGHDPVDVAYTLLQATRLRTVRTEYVSCPSCGRTLFDLEETTARIKDLTGHLPNVTIAIMGCIVNGPGEMADADFGYVGWKPGKVDLYVGKEVVEKSVPEEQAPGRLVELLKRHGVWVEPEPSLTAG